MKRKISMLSSKKTFSAWVGIGLMIAMLTIAGCAAPQNTHPTATLAALPPEITVTQAAQKRDQGAFFVDVRELSEWTQFHIPGTTLIPLGELPSRLKDVPKDREVVVVCRSGNRSQQGRDILLKAGYTSVTSMAGGVTQWQAQKLPIATGQ
jgi:rhodanese-related sulfurtransferase